MNRYELAVALSEINSFDEARRNDICAQAIELLTAAAPAPAEQPVNAWKEAVIESCMVSHIGWDENDAAKSLRQLISWEVQVALDPQVSSEAQALIDRGRSEMTAAASGNSTRKTAYARQSELAKLADNRIAGIGMMLQKKQDEGMVPVFYDEPSKDKA